MNIQGTITKKCKECGQDVARVSASHGKSEMSMQAICKCGRMISLSTKNMANYFPEIAQEWNRMN